MQTYLTISHWHSTQCIYHGMAIIDRTHCFFHSSVSNLTSSSSLALVAVGSSSSAPVSEVLFSGWRWLTRFFRLVCPPSSSPPVALSNLLDTYTRNTEYHAHKGGYLTANTTSCYTYCLHYMHTHIIDSVTLFQRKYTCIYIYASQSIYPTSSPSGGAVEQHVWAQAAPLAEVPHLPWSPQPGGPLSS